VLRSGWSWRGRRRSRSGGVSVDARARGKRGTLLVERDGFSSKRSVGACSSFGRPWACQLGQLGHADGGRDRRERGGNGASGRAVGMRGRAGGGAHEARRRPDHRVCSNGEGQRWIHISLERENCSPRPVIAMGLGPESFPTLSAVSDLLGARVGNLSPFFSLPASPSDEDVLLLAFSLSSASCSRRCGNASGAPMGWVDGAAREGRMEDGLRTMMLG
jgi:hypothetical protein